MKHGGPGTLKIMVFLRRVAKNATSTSHKQTLQMGSDMFSKYKSLKYRSGRNDEKTKKREQQATHIVPESIPQG